MSNAAEPRTIHVPPVALGDVRELTRSLTPRAKHRNERLVRIRRGSVALVPTGGHPAKAAEAQHLARCRAVDRRMTAPHVLMLESAALLHGLYVWRVPDKVQVGSPAVRSGSNTARDIRRHRVNIPDQDVAEVSGIRVTDPFRTAIDCARLLHPHDALVVVDHVLARRTRADRHERDRVDREAEQIRRQMLGRLRTEFAGARGVRQAVAVLSAATPWAESPWETHVRWILLTWGARDVVVQQRVPAGGRRYFVDLAIRIGTKTDGSPIWLIIDVDGREKYGDDPAVTSDALLRERRRDLDIERAGHIMLHLTGAQAGDPATVVGLVREKLPAWASLDLDPVAELLPRPPRRTGAPR